eukprot:3045070-Rhodomonas_salina.1
MLRKLLAETEAEAVSVKQQLMAVQVAAEVDGADRDEKVGVLSAALQEALATLDLTVQQVEGLQRSSEEAWTIIGRLQQEKGELKEILTESEAERASVEQELKIARAAVEQRERENDQDMADTREITHTLECRARELEREVTEVEEGLVKSEERVEALQGR